MAELIHRSMPASLQLPDEVLMMIMDEHIHNTCIVHALMSITWNDPELAARYRLSLTHHEFHALQPIISFKIIPQQLARYMDVTDSIKRSLGNRCRTLGLSFTEYLVVSNPNVILHLTNLTDILVQLYRVPRSTITIKALVVNARYVSWEPNRNSIPHGLEFGQQLGNLVKGFPHLEKFYCVAPTSPADGNVFGGLHGGTRILFTEEEKERLGGLGLNTKWQWLRAEMWDAICWKSCIENRVGHEKVDVGRWISAVGTAKLG